MYLALQYLLFGGRAHHWLDNLLSKTDKCEQEMREKKTEANDKREEMKKFFWNNAAWEEIWSDLIKMLES